MSNVKLSYLEVTARGNFPIYKKPDIHLWDLTMQTLKKQTEQNFEVIIMDLFWDERKDYFKDPSKNLGLRIKHIPATPNIWHEKGLCQICHQFNRGIIHSDGELLFFCADSNMFHPKLFENLWNHYQKGEFVTLGFGADVTYGPTELLTTARDNVVPTEYYRFLDFHGHVHMDQRYNKLFENTEAQVVPVSHNWYYGISTVSLKAALEINGFNQCYDPGVTLSDVDFGERLKMAGYDNLVMCRDCYSIEAYAGTDWHNKMKPRKEVFCTYGLLNYNKIYKRFRANEGYGEAEIQRILQFCKEKCDVRDVCKTLPHRGPFWNKNEMELYNYWKKYGASERIDLAFEREARIQKIDYLEGTFINC